MKIVVSGTSGFVGTQLVAALVKAGHTVVPVREFLADTETADGFVNLANIVHDPAATVRLLETYLPAARRVRCFMQIHSTINLWGGAGGQPEQENFGFRPALLDVYGIGKWLQERRVMQAVAAEEIPQAVLLYLPGILGEGGPWEAVRTQAKQYGYALPGGMSAAARANVMEMADLVAAIEACCELPPAKGQVLRQVVVNPACAELTWDAFLGDNPQPLPGGPVPRLKRLLREVIEQIRGRLRAVGWYSGWLPRRLLARKPEAVPPPLPKNPAQPGQGVVWFNGIPRQLVKRQPYLG